MTARTRSPQETVAQYVSLAERIIDRMLSIHRPELVREEVPVMLSQTIGGTWVLHAEDVQIERGSDGQLNDLAQQIASVACKALDVQAQSRLLRNIQPPSVELPGT